MDAVDQNLGQDLNLTGLVASIRKPDSGVEILSAQIVEHTKRTHSIRVRDYNNKELRSMSNVTVVLRSQGAVMTYKGTVRKSNSVSPNTIEISLYGEELSGERAQKRFDVAVYGEVEALKFDNQIIELNKVQPVLISNISIGGCLIKTSPSCFEKGSQFRLTLDMGNERTTLMCVIARKSDLSAAYAEYGCEFLYKV